MGVEFSGELSDFIKRDVVYFLKLIQCNFYIFFKLTGVVKVQIFTFATLFSTFARMLSSVS